MSNVVTPDLLMTYGVGQQSGSFSTVYVNGVPHYPATRHLYYSGGSLEIVGTGPNLGSRPWRKLDAGGQLGGRLAQRRRAGAAFSGTATPP